MKKIIYLLLAFVLCLSVVGFVACSDDGKESEYYTISDFETEDELMAMNWKNSFGIVKLNTESQYVKSGSASARLEIHGDPMSGAGYTPYGIVYTNDNVYNFRKTDYSDVEAFEFSFYNASDRDTTVKFQFMSSAIYKGGLSSEQSFTLKKGEWTDISMPIDRNLLTAFMDLSAISEFYFKFENREEGQEPLVLYLDRFVAKTTDEPINTDTDIRKENEIESADRAEYLGAWEVTANRGASLTFNTDPEYIREGTGSFHFTAEPTGGVNWPEIVLKSNMLTDISDYDSIYFWMYNDNPDPYDIVTAGGTTIKTVQPGEWTLMDMKVIWIANVMNFTHDAKEYDITNFNNFTISLTNNNKKLSFYFDGFYARKAGEGYIGEDEPGAPIELSQSGVIKVESGKEFTVPTVTNASAYETVEWTISQTLEAAVYEYLVNAEWNNAASFTPADNAGYVIEYKAVDADGKISRASVNVIASKDADAFDMTYGATDGLDTFTDTLMSGTFKSVSAELNTDEKYILFGENSVKLTFPEFTDEAQAAFTWTPGFNINAYDWVTFYFYNPNDTEYTIISTWGAQFKLKPGAWVVRTVPVAQFNSWVGAAPDIHSGEEFSMSFYTPMTVGTAATDIYFQITTHGYHEVPPLVKIPKTTDVVEKGATVTVPESTSKNVTWSLFYNDEPVADSDNIATFVAKNYGIYKVVYSRTEGDLTGTAEYAVYVPDVSTLADLTDAKFTDDVLRDDPTVAVEDDLFLGESAIHVTGTKVGPDIGFVWHTGVYNDLNSVTFYVYNNSDGVVNLVHSWGLVAVMQPGTWTAVTIEGGKLTSDAAGWKDDCSTTQVGRIGGEWVFAFPMNVAGTTNYDITIAVSMDKGEVPAPTIELDKTTDVAATGTEYTVPAVDGAEWEVYFNDALFGGATTNTGFTPTAAGTYEVRYTKEQGGQTAKATLTVHVADLSKIESPNDEFTDDALREDPTVTVEENAFLGASAIHVTGTKVGPDIGFVWHTGVYNDLNSITFYVYNNSDGNILASFGHGLTVSLAAGEWGSASFSEGQLADYVKAWKDDCSTSQVGRIDGEWVIAFPVNVASTTNYDIIFAVSMDKGEIPAPTIDLDKTTDVAATGTEYTVPAVEGAEWEVYFNDALFEGATATGFTPAAAGAYEVRYTKEQGGQSAKATLTVYAADLSKIESPNDEFTDNPNGTMLKPTVEVVSDGFLNAADAINLSGEKTGYDASTIWHTGVYNDLNSITFYVYNNSDGNITFIYGYGGTVIVAPGCWGVVSLAGSQLNDNAGGWTGGGSASQVGRVAGEWLFSLQVNVGSTTKIYDVTIAVAMDKGEIPAPTIELDKTTDIAATGTEYTVPAVEGAEWEVYFNDALFEGATATGFTPAAAGAYEVRYTKEQGGQSAKATLTVHAVDASMIVVPEENFADDPNAGRQESTVSVGGEIPFLGTNTIHVSGTKTLPDMGFVWKSGVFNDLNSLTIYVYNNSDGVIGFNYGAGANMQIQPQSWGVSETLNATQILQCAAGWKDDCTGNLFGRVNGEWVFDITANIAGTTNYEFIVAFVMDKGEIPAPTIELDKTTDVAATGTEYTVPAVDGAEWEVYFNDALFGGATTNTGFTPTAAGTYEVRYTKEQGGQTAKATLTVYVADVSKIVVPNEEFTDDALREDPTVTVEENAFLGASAIHVTGTKGGPDIGFVWHTGITEDINSITFYVYNNSNGVVGVIFGSGLRIDVEPQGYGSTTFAGSQLNEYVGGWKDDCGGTQVGRIDGEWVIAFPANILAVSGNYDFTIAVAVETAA